MKHRGRNDEVPRLCGCGVDGQGGSSESPGVRSNAQAARAEGEAIALTKEFDAIARARGSLDGNW